MGQKKAVQRNINKRSHRINTSKGIFFIFQLLSFDFLNVVYTALNTIRLNVFKKWRMEIYGQGLKVENAVR